MNLSPVVNNNIEVSSQFLLCLLNPLSLMVPEELRNSFAMHKVRTSLIESSNLSLYKLEHVCCCYYYSVQQKFNKIILDQCSLGMSRMSEGTKGGCQGWVRGPWGVVRGG